MAGMVLVNGAGGFLGSWVVELLCSHGLEVRATDLPGADLEPARRAEADVAPADLLNAGAVPRLFDGVTRVVNVAGLFNYSLPYRTLHKANVEVTRNMCEAALKAEVSRFVHISSIAVYGRPETSPIKEDHPINAKNNYERSKREGEDVVFDHVKKGLPAVSLRPAGIYGPRSKYGQAALMALLALVRSAGARRIPVMRGGPKMQHVHVEDVAGAVRAVMEAPEAEVMGRAVNVGDDRPLGQGELFRALMPGLDLEERFGYPYYTRAFWPFIRALLAMPDGAFSRMNGYFGKKWGRVVEDHDLVPALVPALDRDFLGYMNADYALDNSFLKSLGYELKHPDPREGLAGTVSWYKDNRWLPGF